MQVLAIYNRVIEKLTAHPNIRNYNYDISSSFKNYEICNRVLSEYKYGGSPCQSSLKGGLKKQY